MNKMKVISVMIITAILLAGCASKEDKAPEVGKVEGVRDIVIEQVVGIGKVEPEHAIVQLATATGGIVKEVLKWEGDRVSAGEILVKLDDERELLKVEQARSRLRSQQSKVEVEKSNLRETGIRLKNKQKQLATSGSLLSKGAESGSAYDDLSAEAASLEANLAGSLANVQLAESQLAELGVELRQSEEEAGKKNLRAPSDGILLEMKVSPGEALNQLSVYAEFAPAGKKIVRAEVDESFATRLAEGQPVDIRFMGTDKVVAKGKIITLSPFLKKKSLFSVNAGDQEDRLVREVKISLEGDTGLIINEKVECIIDVK